MILDGLEDAYEEGRAMGTFAQDTANDYQLTREEMDDYSIESLRRANAAEPCRGEKNSGKFTANTWNSANPILTRRRISRLSRMLH